MDAWLKKQGLIVRILLMLLPWGWIFEIIARISILLKSTNLKNIIMLILCFPFGYPLAIIDFICLTLSRRFLLE